MESEWLRDAIQFSLKASFSTNIRDPLEGSPQRDPRLRQLVEGLLFSRKFILTYPIVILGCILLFSAVNWAANFIRWRKRRAFRLHTGLDGTFDDDAQPIKSTYPGQYSGNSDPQGVYSSGSSTIEGTASPPRKGIDEDEYTPLLHHGRELPPLYSQRSLWTRTKASLMYQPSPIPIVNKTLPSNGASIVLAAFIALNFFYMLFHINFNAFEFFVLADRFGIVFVANLPLLYLLAAKNQPLKLLTGRSYESLNIFHRRLGELLCFQALLHSAGMIFVWYVLIRPSGFGLLRFLFLPVIWLGVGAFLSYEILYFTSLGSFRRQWYEPFLGLHIVLQVAALVFVFFHHSIARPYVGIALVIFLVDRLVYRLWTKSTTLEAKTEILEDKETVKLSTTIIRRPAGHPATIFGRSITAGWTATNHVFITIPSLARKHILQAHPFTIASAAPLIIEDEAHLDLLIRAQDGFSRDLLNAAQIHKTLNIRVDGPYGSSHARQMLEDSDLALIVVGGSGIAVGWPLIEHLLDSARSSDTEIASLFSLRRQKVVLIWVIHQGSHLSWIGREALANAENRGAEIIVPRATEEIGRPDLAGMITELVDMYAGGEAAKTRVVASGPDSMGRLVRNTCAGLVKDGRNVDVLFEKFGW
ncbi:related to ferric reductase [Phialocephala subalpina]|uniref:Related to ferric reductase n=1 Tax=Phialocephala subalpina TaxID=576137 RepID=A0A1L7WXI1_9HELO|nr:related to ferric reductase [Phialocephala subalpina]